MKLRTKSAFRFSWLIIIVPVISFHLVQASSKYVFASKTDCDRYSLDALYHEKFKPITEDVFADTTEFITRVTQLVSDSLISLMAKLPGRESSDREELNVHRNFNEMKRRFVAEVNKMRKNITSHWETLLSANIDLLLDKPNSTLESVRENVSAVFETYKHTRYALDEALGFVVTPVKLIVGNGLKGIVETAKKELLKANNTEQNSTSNQDPKEANGKEQTKEIDKEELRKKVVNITTDIVPAFLGKVTLSVFERRVDLQMKVEMSSEDRDSALDNLIFDMLMIRSRINSLTDEDLPKTQESKDLSRRNIYMFWSDTALFMYEERKKTGNRVATPEERIEKYKKMWSSEDDLEDTLINLMQVYP